MTKDGKRRIGLTLTPEALRILDAYAKANGLTRSTAVEIAARQLERAGAPAPTKKGGR